MNKRTLTAIAIILGLLFLGSLFWGLSNNSKLTEANAQMSEEAKADARPVMERIVERANGSLSQARQETAKLTKRDTYFPSVT